MYVRKFPEGSESKRIDLLQAAAMRAIDAYAAIGELADMAIDEFEQITCPGVVKQHISDEDSLVIAIKEFAHGRES